MKTTSSALASNFENPLKISEPLGVSKWPSTSLRDLARNSRINACSTLNTSRKSRGFGALSVIASTNALPLSLIVAKVLPMMKTPSEAPRMITNSKGCISTSRWPPSAA
jgi:hypothetical protein